MQAAPREDPAIDDSLGTRGTTGRGAAARAERVSTGDISAAPWRKVAGVPQAVDVTGVLNQE
jgi:hypothetical protein